MAAFVVCLVVVALMTPTSTAFSLAARSPVLATAASSSSRSRTFRRQQGEQKMIL